MVASHRPRGPFASAPALRAVGLGFAVLSLAAGAAVPSCAAPLPAPRPPHLEKAPSPPAAADAAASPCLAMLAAAGVAFAPAEARAPQEACRIEHPVRLERITTGGRAVDLPDRPVLACSFAVALAGFVRQAAAPLTRGIVQGELVGLGTGGGFECRPRNRAAGARMSAHGRGLAVDVAWLEIAGRGRVPVTATDPAVQSLVLSLRKSACGWFTTVLGPGSDAAHADHLHLDREPRGRDGESRLCQ